MSTTKKIARNFIWLFTGQAISAGLSFIYVIYLARILGVKAFGLLNYVQSFLIYMLLIVDAGFSIFGTREIAKDQTKIDHISMNIFFLRIVWSLLVYGISIAILMILPISGQLKMLFALTFLLVLPQNVSPEWIYQGIEKFQFVSWGRILNRLLYVVLLVLFVKGANDLLKVPLLEFISGTLIALAFLIIVFRHFVAFDQKEIRLDQWKHYFIEALPMGISFIFIQLYYNVDSIMLGLMGKIEGVGLYNAAYKIVLTLLIFAAIVGNSIFPALSRLFKENLDAMKQLVTKIYKLTLFFGVPIAVGGMVLSAPIILLVYGQEYYSAFWALQILIWSVLTVYVSVPFAFALLAANFQKEYLHFSVVGALFNIALNFYFIPKYGFVGAAVTTIITEIIVRGMIFHFFSKHIFYIPIYKDLWKYGFAAAIMGAFLYISRINLALNLVLGASIYLLISFVLKTIPIDEISSFRKALS